MSGDVGEVENSITSSLDMLMKSPILIIIYFVTLVTVSWQLTLFTIIVLPGMGWLMGVVGRKLKRQSLEAQAKWSDTMSQLEDECGSIDSCILPQNQCTSKPQYSYNQNRS